MAESVLTYEGSVPPAAGAARDDSREWQSFVSPHSDSVFCASWLALLCAHISGVHAGLLLLREARGEAYAPAAVWPDAQHDLSYLSTAAERCLAQRRGLTLAAAETSDVAPGRSHVACPVEANGETMGVVVLDLRARPSDELQAVLRELLWSIGSIEALLCRQQLAHKADQLHRAGAALDLMQAVNDQASLAQAAMALVNELTSVTGADRVSLGLERRQGRGVRLQAISRTAWFDPKSRSVSALEAAMEEAVDQLSHVGYPAPPGAQGQVMGAQRNLAKASGASCVLTLPLMAGGNAIGAITLERDRGAAVNPGSVTLAQALCEVMGPVLRMRQRDEHWLGGRTHRTWTDGRARLLGPSHQAIKLGAIGFLGAALYLAVADAPFRVNARTFIEGAVQRAAVAPFDGFIVEAPVRAGDLVKQGDLLAVMDDRDLQLERVRWQAEKEQLDSKFAEALAKRERAASVIVAAQLEQAQAQLNLAQDKLARTRLSAPFDGVVVSGDLSQMLGAPIEKGKVLFELAPLDLYRVVLRVDERDIRHVTVGQHGSLTLAGLSGESLPFVVRSVTPVSTPQDGRNSFRVEAALEQAVPHLRPGMEGVGKIEIGERGLLWIWTRPFIDWLRLATWSWTP